MGYASSLDGYSDGSGSGGKCGLGDYIIGHVLHSPMPVVELLAGLGAGLAWADGGWSCGVT